ncbi:hypothetical protein ACOALZ_15380 [Nocardiopsis algeriensis]|uniref:hypothetical protein n=1 Tax=Nocardiopsis algeriensis TaxID=1478215 RepID=UPI003B435920
MPTTGTADRTSAVKDFLSRGTKAALAVFLAGSKVLLFFSALSGYAPEVAASYGSALTLLLVCLTLGTAYQVLVVSRLRRDTLLKDPERTAELAATVLAGSVFLALGALAASGAALAFQHSPGLFAAFLLTYLPAVLLAPVTYAAGGVLLVTGQEGVRLRTSAENFVAHALLAAAVFLWEPSPVVALVVIGAGCSLVDLATLVRTVVRTEPQARAAVLRSVREGARRMWSAPVLRAVPGSFAGALDALVLVAAFAVVSQVVTVLPAAQAAAALACIAVVRTLVVPLKPYGMVAGRLLRASGADLREQARRLRLFTASTALLLWPLALVFLALPGPVAGLLGLEADPVVLWGVRLVGAQLLLEPCAGFLSSVLKVVVAPHATVRSLVVVLWCGALPAIGLLAVSGHLTLVSLWSVLLLARAGFALASLISARRALTAPEEV